eukprot:CAMPEP_0202776008 /NCGR_PEP_ID=MMETSP1388-20130828/49654_1 /ASSEMBLY_ACC=CAM_ASM_000864 /TAXON_ID=37098 /ORGANISM="Isochrysis sp, Strain CCMP1244" /LENGTH=44 /DNA_ID= /DNA_START= /DNA_END= /DNA_ORIENTATION=
MAAAARKAGETRLLGARATRRVQTSAGAAAAGHGSAAAAAAAAA